MSEPIINRGNFSYKVPDSFVRERFVASIPRNDAGNGKNTLETFLRVADDITQNARSFTFDDFQARARVYQLNAYEVKTYFAKWIETLVDLRRVEVINGCYDNEVYLNI